MSEEIDIPKTFRYHDGAGEIHGDPTALRRALLLATGGKLNALLADYYAGNRARKTGQTGEALEQADLLSCRAAEALLPAVREAFELAPLDLASGKGATDDDVDAVLCAFLDYLSAVKKKRATSPSTAPPTGVLSNVTLPPNSVLASRSTAASPSAGTPPPPPSAAP